MEEQQIQEFVHRVVTDEAMRRELVFDPLGVIGREEYSPRVVDVLLRLVPCLAFESPLRVGEKWWHA